MTNRLNLFLFSVLSAFLCMSSFATATTTSTTTVSSSSSNQFYLSISGPYQCGLGPYSGYYAVNSLVILTANQICSGSGIPFISWRGTGSGSYTGPNAIANVSMYGPITEIANYEGTVSSTSTSTTRTTTLSTTTAVSSLWYANYSCSNSQGSWICSGLEFVTCGTSFCTCNSGGAPHDCVDHNTTSTSTSTTRSTTLTTTVSPTSHSCGGRTILYVGNNLTCGQWSVQLAALGSVNSGGVSPAAINVYYNGVLTNTSSIYPGNTARYSVNGSVMYVNVNQTFAGLYVSQQWASITLYLPSPSTSTISPTTTVSPTFRGCEEKAVVYVGNNITCRQWSVQLTDLGNASSSGISPAMINVYYDGALTNSSLIYPGTTSRYYINGSVMYVNVNQTFAGLYASQQWASITLYVPSYSTTTTPTTSTIPQSVVFKITPTSGVAGTQIYGVGYGFTPNANLTANICLGESCVTLSLAGTCTPTSIGKITGCSAYIPSDAHPGTYKITITDSVHIADARFTVHPENNITNTTPNETSGRSAYTVMIQRGWNLFSIPLIYATHISSTCTSTNLLSPPLALVNGHYEKTTSISGGVGYWLRSNSQCSITFSGAPLTEADLPSLSAGWNSMGALNSTISSDSVLGNCTVTSGPWGFDSNLQSYVKATQLEPGKGYLVNVVSACGTGSAGGSAPPPLPSSGSGTAV